MNLHIISREQAKLIGMKFYFTGIACKNGHISERYTSTKNCFQCKQKDHFTNHETNLQRQKLYHNNNREKINKRHRDAWSSYYEDNRERYIKKAYRYFTRCSERMLCNKWADEIQEIYLSAKRRRERGEDVEVDHIIPINGDSVSGLHVPWNMRIISREENRNKKNKLIPELV